MRAKPMHVVVLSRNYPNKVLKRMGLWVQRQTVALSTRCRMTVIAPSLYCPPLPAYEDYTKFRCVERWRMDGTVDVHHPRFISGPGNSTYVLDAASQYLATRSLIARLHRHTPVDLIHAHFSYPDGVTAVMLAGFLGIPVVITEHNLWRPWMDEYPLVRRQAIWAIERAAAVVAVSRAAHLNMEAVAHRPISAHVIPVGVDGELFDLKEVRNGDDRQLLFVGWLNYVKGADVILRAMAILLRRRPLARLTLIGGSMYKNAQRTEQSVRRLAVELGLGDRVCFAGPKEPSEVARAMQESDVLVLPSRRESCGAVLLEALATGTPVVATRCGGPEDIVTDEVGALAAVDDPEALAATLDRVLERRAEFDPRRLREFALSRFSWDHLANRYLDIYARAVMAPSPQGAGRAECPHEP